MENKRALFLVLHNIFSKHNQIFFSKLFLYEQLSDENDDQPIRHYDIECEGVDIIRRVTTLKIEEIKVRSFFLIKNYTTDKEKSFKLVEKTEIKKDRNITQMSSINKQSKQRFYFSGTNSPKQVQKTMMRSQTQLTIDQKLTSRKVNPLNNNTITTQNLISRIQRIQIQLQNKSKKNKEDIEMIKTRTKQSKRSAILKKINSLHHVVTVINQQNGDKLPASSTSISIQMLTVRKEQRNMLSKYVKN